MKFSIFKIKKLPAAARKGLAPRKEFLTQGKDRFLAAFDASALAANARPARLPRTAVFFRIGIGAMAMLCLAVGVSAYADTANVPPTNPLYPLKRLSESVRLALAPAPEKAQLQATFAVRRANEIAALETSAPSSTLIPKLTRDLDQDISSSLSAAVSSGFSSSSEPGESGHGHGRVYAALPAPAGAGVAAEATSTAAAGAISVYCGAFDVSTSGLLVGHLESNLVLHPDALAQFNEQCGSESRARGDNGTSTYPSGSSTTTSTTIRVRSQQSPLIRL